MRQRMTTVPEPAPAPDGNGQAIFPKQPPALIDRSLTLYETTLESLPIGALIVNMKGIYQYGNPVYLTMSGRASDWLHAKHWSSVLVADDRQRVDDEWKQAFVCDTHCQIEARIANVDRRTAWFSINAARLPDRRGFILTLEKITSRHHDGYKLRAAEAALHMERERARVALNSIGDAVISIDIECRVTYLNRAAESLTGWSKANAVGKPVSTVFHVVDSETRQLVSDPAQRAIEENRIVGLAMGSVLIRCDGSEVAIEDSAAPIRDHDGQVTGAVIVFHHINQSHVLSNRMSYLAQHDALTDLPNRVLLEERLSRAIGLAQRHRWQVALLFLDLDGFKAVNDRLGHAAGDSLLQSIASRLKSCVRDTDTVSRIGGDEFVILLTEVHGADDARQVADIILQSLQASHHVSNQKIDITGSLGISLFPESGGTPEELIHLADTAMYHAKRKGRNGYQFFKFDMLCALRRCGETPSFS